jgi:hypothetical protein
LLAIGLAVAAPATARIYWANETGNSIGRANADGSGERLNFITGATAPRGVAIGGGYLYWAHGGAADDAGRIGRARLDGIGTPDQALLPISGTSPGGIAVDGTSVYWTHVVSGPNPSNQCFAASGCGKIGRAGLDGTDVNQLYVPAFPASLGTTPCGLATEPDHFYWSDSGTGAIGQAHGPFGPNPAFITGASDPCGVAFAAGHIYWANRGDNTIGRAEIEAGKVDQSFIDTGAGNSPCGVAADASYLYWTTANGKVWRRNIDGTGKNNAIVTDALGPCGIAVDPTANATPSTYTFAQTAVGSQSDIQAFFVANTGSSVLDVSEVSLIGPNAGDFEQTGDGCTVTGVSAGGLCVLNFRFAPTAAGPRSAVVRITSNASNSPIDISLSADAVAPGGGGGSGGGESSGAGGGASVSEGVGAGGAAQSVEAAVPALGAGSAIPVSPAAGLRRFRSPVIVGRSGRVRLGSATNPPATATRQTLTGTLASASTGRRKPRAIVLGRGRTTIPVGHSRSVVAKLGARARKALRARGSLAVRSRIVVRGPDEETATVERRLTLRASRGGRGRR